MEKSKRETDKGRESRKEMNATPQQDAAKVWFSDVPVARVHTEPSQTIITTAVLFCHYLKKSSYQTHPSNYPTIMGVMLQVNHLASSIQLPIISLNNCVVCIACHSYVVFSVCLIVANLIRPTSKVRPLKQQHQAAGYIFYFYFYILEAGITLVEYFAWLNCKGNNL